MKLSEPQRTMLGNLARLDGPTSVSGSRRTATALENRGLVRIVKRTVEITAKGREEAARL